MDMHEALNEWGHDGRGLVVRGKHWLILGSTPNVTRLQRTLSYELLSDQWITFSKLEGSQKNQNFKVLFLFFQNFFFSSPDWWNLCRKMWICWPWNHLERIRFCWGWSIFFNMMRTENYLKKLWLIWMGYSRLSKLFRYKKLVWQRINSWIRKASFFLDVF